MSELYGPFSARVRTPKADEDLNSLRAAFKSLHLYINTYTPECAEKTLGMRKLEESFMWFEKAITFEGERYLKTGVGPAQGEPKPYSRTIQFGVDGSPL